MVDFSNHYDDIKPIKVNEIEIRPYLQKLIQGSKYDWYVNQPLNSI